MFIQKSGANQLAPVSSYCRVCATVLESPLGLAGKIESDDLTKERLYQQTHAKLNTAIAQRSNAYSCVRWPDLTLYLDRPRVRSHQLYTRWNGTNISPHELTVHLRGYLGITAGTTQRVVQAPAIGDVIVDERFIQHNIYKHDADHLNYFPLVISTLAMPDEINDMPAQPASPGRDARQNGYNFLKIYEHGDRMFTHLVVVSQNDKRAVTAYRYDDESEAGRPDKDRKVGTLIHSRLV